MIDGDCIASPNKTGLTPICDIYKMETIMFFSVFVTFTLLYGVRCNEEFQPYTDEVKVLDKRFETFEKKQEQRLLSLKTDLKTDIRQHVHTVLSEILRGDSFEDFIKSEVVSEMVHLKRASHQMRRHLHQLITSLGQVRMDNTVYREALLIMKGERENSEMIQLSDLKRQNSELRQKLREQNHSYTQVHNTSYKESDSVIECSKCFHSEIVTNRLIEHDRQISELNETLMADLCKESKNTINKKETSLETRTKSYHTTPSTTAAESTTKSSPTIPSSTAAESTTKSYHTTPSTNAAESTTKSSATIPSTTAAESTTKSSPTIPSTTAAESTTKSSPTIPSTTAAESTTKSSPTIPSSTAAESTTKSSPTIPSTTAAEPTTKSSPTIPSTTAAESTTVTTRLTTSDTKEERSQILVAPLWSSSSNQFRKVNIHSHTMDLYRYLNLKEVDSVIFISRSNSILIGLDDPAKIISTKLYSSRVVTVRHHTGTYGMAADEKRGIIFLTTHHPTRTISRMSLQGKHFTSVVSLTHYGSNPRAIAVHPETKMIYSCNYAFVFSIRYDGSRLTTLDSGKQIRAVTLDISNGLLYYGYEEKLMKMSLSTNTSSEMIEFGFTIWNLVYYRDTVYYISYSEPYGTLGAVDVRQDIVSYTLHTVNVPYVDYFAICLIP